MLLRPLCPLNDVGVTWRLVDAKGMGSPLLPLTHWTVLHTLDLTSVSDSWCPGTTSWPGLIGCLIWLSLVDYSRFTNFGLSFSAPDRHLNGIALITIPSPPPPPKKKKNENKKSLYFIYVIGMNPRKYKKIRGGNSVYYLPYHTNNNQSYQQSDKNFHWYHKFSIFIWCIMPTLSA